MRLLDLPSELVREILHTLDPQSFFTCLQTSKIFREHALASSSLLRDHLKRMPGTKLHVHSADIETTLLLDMFSRRASQHLFNGSNWRTDLHTFRQTERVDRRNCVMVTTSWPDEDWGETSTSRGFSQVHSGLMFLNILSEKNVVNVYFIEAASTECYLPRLKHVIIPPDVSQCFPLHQEEGAQLEVVKVAPYTPDPSMLLAEGHPGPRVGVLYRLKTSTRDDTPIPMKLILFRLDTEFGPVIIEAFDLQCSHHQRVLSLAISDQREAVIAWNYGDSMSEFDTMSIHTVEEDKLSLERSTSVASPFLHGLMPSRVDRIGGAIIKGRSVHLHTAAYPIPQWTLASISRPRDQVERRDTHLPFGIDQFIRPVIGIPIAHRHHHHMIDERPNSDGTPGCINTALELVVSRHLSTANTTTNWALPPRSGAYLMKAVHYPSRCKPFSMTKDYHHLRHTYAARLVGVPDLFSLSTLGLLIAVSPKAYRIAIVSWKTVRVWAVDPRAFLDREYSLGCDVFVPGDYAYIEGCGWEFYNKSGLPEYPGPEFEIDTVDLYAVELPSAGVLHSIEFRGEDELWGWGDGGLARWNFDSHADGKRGNTLLET